MVYLLYGEERYLLENKIKRIKKEFGELIQGINYIQIGETEIDNIISDIEMIANEIIIMNHGKFLCTLDDEENVEDAYLKWIGDKKI
mgnify:CR=1 FL=1